MSHFNVYNCEEQSHKTVSQTTTCEEKGEPKQIRTEAPLVTSLNRLTPPQPLTVLAEVEFLQVIQTGDGGRDAGDLVVADAQLA